MGYPRARKCGAKRDPRGKAPFSPISSLVHSPASWASAIWRSLYYTVDQNRCGLCSWETCSPESKEICPTAGGIVGRESRKGENICGLSASSLTCSGLLVLVPGLPSLQWSAHIPGSCKSRMYSRELLLSRALILGLGFIVVILPSL